MDIREKKHRLPREFYKGQVSVAFTICLKKDFYDHVIRKSEDIVVQVRYILDNPVRKGLVSSWEEYPFKGSIGCKLEDVLNNIM